MKAPTKRTFQICEFDNSYWRAAIAEQVARRKSLAPVRFESRSLAGWWLLEEFSMDQYAGEGDGRNGENR
jgi:hypothetical protein